MLFLYTYKMAATTRYDTKVQGAATYVLTVTYVHFW